MTTHVLLVTDMSGSMSGLAEDVRGGFNSYLDGLAQGDGEFRITAAAFDTEYMSLCVDTTLADAPRLTTSNYMPRGGTALLDAVGRTIGGFELRVPTLGDDDKVILVIQTDGHENSSREYTYDDVKKLLNDRTGEAGKWAVIYIGAGADTWDQAQRMGVRADSYVNTSGSRASTQSTYDGMTRATHLYSKGGSAAESNALIAAATEGK